MNSLACTICLESFDERKYRPRCLPCGHTICNNCIDHSIAIGVKICPNCRKPHNAARALDVPVNFIVEDIKQDLSDSPSTTASNKSDNTNTLVQNQIEKELVTTQWRISKVGSFKADEKHLNIYCDCCNGPVCGFRYKCMTCENYDLCGICEKMIYHTQHPMFRIPNPQSKLTDAYKIEIKCESAAYDPMYVHEHIECDVCESDVFGYRYKCLICKDFDLCHKCEHTGKHSQHLVIRLPATKSQIIYKRRGTK